MSSGLAATLASLFAAYRFHAYILLFIVMCLEGAMAVGAGGFGAAVGYFNPWTIIALSIAGNFLPDLLYYTLGYRGREAFLRKYARRFGVTERRISKLEYLYEHHAGKTLAIVKTVPGLGPAGILIAGASHMPFRRFAFWSFVTTIPISAAYFLIGYYSGAAYVKIIHYIDYGGYVLAGIIILTIAIFYGINHYSKRLATEIEED